MHKPRKLAASVKKRVGNDTLRRLMTADDKKKNYDEHRYRVNPLKWFLKKLKIVK